MEARTRRYAPQASPERTKVWTEPPPKFSSQQQQHGSKVPVVYYLCRNRHLEHPHFMEVPLSSSDGLYLKGKNRSWVTKKSFFHFDLFQLLGWLDQMWLIGSIYWGEGRWPPCILGLARGNFRLNLRFGRSISNRWLGDALQELQEWICLARPFRGRFDLSSAGEWVCTQGFRAPRSNPSRYIVHCIFLIGSSMFYYTADL